MGISAYKAVSTCTPRSGPGGLGACPQKANRVVVLVGLLTVEFRELETIDMILLTHPTISHLGAYVYLYKTAPELFENIPIYATLPVINMGRMATMDSYRSAGLLGPLLDSQVTVNDVEEAFDKIHSLKYSQPFTLGGKLEGVTITAFNAGHTLGGTIWRIQKDHESIVYADEWNHAKDSHLNGAFLQNGNFIEALSRPTALICGSKISEPFKDRKDALIKDIKRTISKGGTVLIPTSSGGRVLELCHILDAHWRKNKMSAPLLYYSHVGKRTMSYASSMLEWMSSSIIDEWQVQNNSPFDTKHLKVITDLKELEKMDGPKVVLASGEAMEVGFARSIFASVCDNDASTIILTERPGYGTLSDMLYTLWKEERGKDKTEPYNLQLTTKISLSYNVEQRLDGEELDEFNEMIRTEKEKQNQEEKQALMEMRSKNILEQEQDDEESSDESGDEGDLSDKMDLEVLIYKDNVYDYDVRGSAGKNRMFPFTNKRRRVDDYGEVIKVQDFIRANERPDGNESSVNKDSSTKIGETKKWSQEDYGGETQKLDRTSEKAQAVKIVKTEEELKVLCCVNFIDFEGLVTERSMGMLIPQIRPKKLIMLPGDSGMSVTEEFYKGLAQDGAVEEVIRALPNQVVKGSMNSYPFSVRIAPELEGLLKWQKILGDYSVAHITGKLVFDQDEENGQAGQQSTSTEASEADQKDADGDVEIKEEAADGPTTNESELAKEYSHLNKKIKMMPLETAKELAAAPRSDPLLVGDIKLAELKKKLIAHGHKAEFRAEGVLVCDDKVAVRKTGEGRLTIEGGVSSEFYETKSVVRNLLAIV